MKVAADNQLVTGLNKSCLLVHNGHSGTTDVTQFPQICFLKTINKASVFAVSLFVETKCANTPILSFIHH